MSQTKAQILNPLNGNLSVTGVVTASSFVGNVTGTASTSTAAGTAYALEGSPNLNVGVVTASSFVGDVTGNADTATTATNAQGLTGTPDITVNNVVAAAATFTGNVSIAGTLTYEDVTNVDSIGLVTARNGIQVLSGGIDAVGVVTATSFTGDVTGNLTGTASTATESGTAYGLTGSPSIVVGVATVNTTLSLDGVYEQAAEAVAALDIDLSTGNYFTKSLSSSSSITFSNPPASGTVGSFTLQLTLTGASTAITWPGSVYWNGDVGQTAPALTDARTHLFMFTTSDGGTTYRGAALVDYTN